MFNISLQINGDGEATQSQARAVIAALVNFYGPGIIPASYEQVGQVARATGPVNIHITPTVSGDTKTALLETASAVARSLAPDGYPTPDLNAGADDPDVSKRFPMAASAGEVERDKEGIPWDERIHASTKTKTQAGIWTRRRNLDDAPFDAVMAELRAANTARTLEAAQALTETSAAEAFTPPASVTIPPATIPAPPAAAVPTPPAPAPAPAATGEAPTFVEIMKKVTTGQSSGKLTQASLQENLAAVGLKNIGELAAPTAGDARMAFGAIIDAVLA